ncbi:SPFH domain-containing protein [Dactylosporangium sp. NPDC048998]|uniref:SPFH domain-containing protein n=1 Tax=Dactylosporangium sp. NPDC048998 TaxID=3363976 RepID=UPI00371CE409
MSNTNTYLDQVVRQQERLEADLRSKRSVAPPASFGPPGPPQQQSAGGGGRGGSGGSGGSGQPAPNAVEVRVTGFGRWKTVLVPPNAFVVHTRRGRAEPLHVGLGVSFRYNPATDSYLVVPGAMQTILINAYCICRELQGVLVQAYVQWIIQDFSTAYRRLDFGDAEDPMRLVNLQLKEQAEAAIKDKVSTMGVADVLSDKQPIIEELTARLRAVAEGSGGAQEGLGLRIVTVQIKEAVVSSSRLWENLQKPYRSEQGRIARLAELATEEAVAERELAAGRQRETQRIESERELADLRARNAALEFDRESAETLRRSQREQEGARALAELQDATSRHALALERQLAAEEAEIGRLRIEREAELTRLAADSEIALAAARARAAHEEALLELERARIRAGIDNDQSAESLQARLIDALPEIVEKLPKPAELRSVTIGGNDATTVAGLVAELTAVVGALQSALPRRGQ